MAESPPYDMVIAAPNGALDSYYIVPGFTLDAVNRATRVFHTAGGKGHNTARAAVGLGGRVLSIGIVGGHAGRFIQDELRREGIDHDLVWADHETRRSNTFFVEAERDTTGILEPGQAVGSDVQERFTARIEQRAASAPYFVLTGSLPPDFPPGYYRSTIDAVKRSGVKTCIDSSGEPLRLAAQAGPALIKVNRREFCLAFGCPDRDLDLPLVRDIFHRLAERGLEWLIITDGGRGAYVLSQACEPFRVSTSVPAWISTAGAGDTFMAALVLALRRGEGIQQAAQWASAAAAANLQQLGCGMFDPADVDRFLGQTEIDLWREEA